MYIIPNFLVLHVGENFMKIQTKIPKLQMHEILHKNESGKHVSIHIFMHLFMSFYDGEFTALHC